jgi:hypothetical protein
LLFLDKYLFSADSLESQNDETLAKSNSAFSFSF